MSCKNWFFHNCLTTENSACCSINIDRIPCERNFCHKNSTSYSKSECQKCTDFENCFNNDTECKSWDNTKCPLGILNQDYSDSNRIDFVEFKKNVLPINLNDTILYKCYSSFSSDDSVFIFKNETLKNLIIINHILVSDQVDGVMHKIDSIYDLNKNFTLISAIPASIEEIIDYSDFKNIDLIYAQDNQLTREQIPDDDFFDYMKNFKNTTLHHIDSQVKNYKCIGKTYESILNNTFFTEYSTFIIMKATVETRSFKVNDLLSSEISHGFLEKVKNINQFNAGNVKTIIETELVSCHDLNFGMNYIEFLNKTKKELDCMGGIDLIPGLLLVNETVDSNLIGNIIVGRQSDRYIMQIFRIQEHEGYLFFESLPIIGLDDDNKPISLMVIKSITNNQASKIDLNLFTYTKTLRRSFDFGLIIAEITGSLKADIALKFGLKFDEKIKEISTSLNSNLEINLSYHMGILTGEKEFFEKLNILSNIKIFNFYIPIGLFRIPGEVFLDLDFEKNFIIKRFSKTDITLRLKSKTVYEKKFNYLIENNSFNYKPIVDHSTSFADINNFQNLNLYRNSTYSIDLKFTPKLKVRWPSIFSVKKTTKKKSFELFPAWLNAKQINNRKINFDINFEFSASFPLVMKSSLNFCSWKCVDGSKSNELFVRYGLDPIYFDFLINLIIYSKKFHIPSTVSFLKTNSKCLSNIIPCCSCNNNQPGIIDPKTKNCMCECFCDLPYNTSKSYMDPETNVCQCDLCPDQTIQKKVYGVLVNVMMVLFENNCPIVLVIVRVYV